MEECPYHVDYIVIVIPSSNAIKTLRVIPQGTVDNNLGPDRLAGPKALYPNYCR